MDRKLLDAAVAAAGTPVWVFDLGKVTENARRLREIAGEDSIFYAIKANDHPAVLAAALAGGVGAEAASGREYRLARAAGFEGREIIFNGPLKTDEELELATREGALVNADNLPEVQRLAQIASDSRLGLRIKSNLIAGAVGDRFGLTDTEALVAADHLKQRGVRVEQLHTHLGSYAVLDEDGPTARRIDLIWPRGPELTAKLAARMIDVFDSFASAGSEPDSISLGGGLPGLPAAAEHVKAARQKAASADVAMRLTFEPGRALVGDAVSLVCRVVQVRKNNQAGKQEVVVDAGTNLLPAVQWRDAELSSLDVGPDSRPTTVFGPLCLQSDVLAWKSPLPPLEVGDLLVAERVGAYNWVRSTSFIFPTAPVVLVEGDEMTLDREP